MTEFYKFVERRPYWYGVQFTGSNAEEILSLLKTKSESNNAVSVFKFPRLAGYEYGKDADGRKLVLQFDGFHSRYDPLGSDIEIVCLRSQDYLIWGRDENGNWIKPECKECPPATWEAVTIEIKNE